MADADQVKDKKHRSPAYPFVSLARAVERVRSFYDAARRHPAPVPVAIKQWGFSEKSSGGQQTIAALKQYGLMSDEGVGPDRRVRLTDRAFRIILDEVPNSIEKAAAIREAALAPKLFEEMFGLWGSDLPSDDIIRTFLRRDKGFNDDILGGVVRSYKETLSYANLKESDNMPATESEAEQTLVPVYEQTAMLPTGLTSRHPQPMVSTFATGSPAPAVAREVSSLTEGEAVLQWPANLSLQSVEDLEAWLQLVIGKLKRRHAEARKPQDGEAQER